MFPLSSRSGHFRCRNQRYCPSAPRTRASTSRGTPLLRELRQSATSLSTSSGCITSVQCQPCTSFSPTPRYSSQRLLKKSRKPSGRAVWINVGAVSMISRSSLMLHPPLLSVGLSFMWNSIYLSASTIRFPTSRLLRAKSMVAQSKETFDAPDQVMLLGCHWPKRGSLKASQEFLPLRNVVTELFRQLVSVIDDRLQVFSF